MQLKFITLAIGTLILISTNLSAVESEDNPKPPPAKEGSSESIFEAPLKQFEESTEHFNKIEEDVSHFHHHKHH